MTNYFELENFDSPWWDRKKEELLKGIDDTLERGKVDTEVLVLMREMVKKSRIRVSMEEFFKEN